ncbi:hypothetical protein LZ30DRAFT_743339 [Colletotrichum cereale]|nr:hypothetical protein LZ30DRAFT_743339 [Colletotrichum cereale]
MKLSTLAVVLGQFALLATPGSVGRYRYGPNRSVKFAHIPACVVKCMKELEWRLEPPEIPPSIIVWCDMTSPPHRADWVIFGRKMDECKMVQCTNVGAWYDMATWHWRNCHWHDHYNASLAWVNDYRVSAWWPNDEGRPRPPSHESWISENRTAPPPAVDPER